MRVDVSKSGIGGGVTNGVIQQPLSLDYEFSFPDTATAADVATQHSGTLVIPVGSSGTYTLTLPAALGDMLDEDDEQFTITLRNPRLTTTVASITATDGTISNQTSIEITIVDDDTTQVQFADTSMNVNVNEDAGNAEFTITLIPANALPLTVSYETSDGTASAGSDYTATSGSITISALAGSASFSIPVRHDSDNDESSESFTVTLTDTDRGELGTPIAATATIINKEPIPYVVSAASDASGNVVFVTFSEPVTNNLNFGDTELARDTNFELSRLSDRSFAVVSSFSFTPDSPIVKLNLSKSIPHGESVTLSYTNYRGNIRNSLGKRLANFQEVPVLPARPDTPVISTQAESVNTASFTIRGTAEAAVNINLWSNRLACSDTNTGGTRMIGSTTAGTNGEWEVMVILCAGVNTFTATATDDNDNTGTSGEVIITLDSVAPTVLISSASGDNGATTNDQDLSYTAIFTEAVNGFDEGDITVTGTANLGSPSVTNFSVIDSRTYTFNVEAISDGSVTVSIAAGVAQDSAGNGNTASNNHSLTIDSTAPTVSITTNTPQTVNTASFTLIGDADAGSLVDVLKDGSSIGTTTATGGAWTIIVTLDEGVNIFTAKVTDNVGNESAASNAVIITLEIPVFIEKNMVETRTVTTGTNDRKVETITVGVTLSVSQTVTITINAFTTATATMGEKDAINAATNTNTDDFDTVKNNFMFLGGSSDVVKVDLLENAIVDIDIMPTGSSDSVTGVCFVDSPCKVSLSYTDADLERLGDISASELVVFHYTNKKWTELDSTVDINAMTVTGETISFSPFVLGTVSRASAQFHQAITARFTQALVANVARTVEGRLGTAFSDTPQLASYQLDGQTVQLNGSDNLQDSMMNKLPHYAKALKDGGMDWKAMLSRSSFVLPLNTAGDPDSEQSGMTLWGRGDYTKLSGKSDGLDWNGSLVGFQVGIDSRIRDDLLVGGLVSFGNGKADYTDNRTDGAYKLKNMTGVHPYMAWTNGDMSLWGSVGYGQGRAEVSTGNVTSKVSMLSLSGGVKGKLSQTGLSLKGDISLVRTDVENTIKVDNKQRLRLVLESERQRMLASGGTITPVLEAGLRYDSGDGESGLGAVLGAGIRHNLDGWVVKGKVHAVVGQNNYQEWGIHGTIEKALNDNQQGLTFSLSPSYGATDISMQQVYGRDQTSVSNNGTSNDYAVRLNARMDYGLSVSGIRGMLIPYSEATLGGQSKHYELGINWKRHSAFNINLSVERETRDTSKQRILLEGKVQF